ncbi:MAG: hypothetical protein ACE15F_22890, partial [bacterium]
GWNEKGSSGKRVPATLSGPRLKLVSRCPYYPRDKTLGYTHAAPLARESFTANRKIITDYQISCPTDSWH